MALIYSSVPCVAAGTFTTNVVKAAPVKWDQKIVKQGGAVQAIIVNSGIANACTGEEGMQYCEETAQTAAEVFGIQKEQVLVSSTGVIGKQLPMEKIQAGTTAISVEDIRWKYCHVKTLNLIPNCMARSEAKRKGAGKAILVKDGIVTEEKSGSILIVQNGCILTHVENEDILPSTTKKILEALCEKEQIPFREGNFTLDELYAADEVIVADTNTECSAVLKVDGHTIRMESRDRF